MSAHVDDDGASDESAGNGAAAMFAMFCQAASALFSLSFSLYLRFCVSLSLSVNEAFVFVHASKLIKEFNTVNLLRLVETLRIKALKIDSGCAVGFH